VIIRCRRPLDAAGQDLPENEPGLALHQRLCFRAVGIRGRIGRLDGARRDVVLLELWL